VIAGPASPLECPKRLPGYAVCYDHWWPGPVVHSARGRSAFHSWRTRSSAVRPEPRPPTRGPSRLTRRMEHPSVQRPWRSLGQPSMLPGR